ncbi:hypothetical protein DFH09DRAFT_1331401 [Mycena vulgaris]|nr:hypothetical protein DFH09DRAFT_1331401 [Mycena vulgaris]
MSALISGPSTKEKQIRSKFRVNLGGLVCRDAANIDPAEVYKATFAPPTYYPRHPTTVTLNMQDLNQFFRREC